MSTTSSDNPETVPTLEVALSDAERRSTVSARPEDAQLIGKFMSYMGLRIQNRGTVNIGKPDGDQVQQAVMLGWTPLAHRSAEEVAAGITKVVNAYQSFINGGQTSREEVYTQAYAFNQLLCAERIANTDPVRRITAEINAVTGIDPYPGLCIVEQPNQDGLLGFSLQLVPNLWATDQPLAN